MVSDDFRIRATLPLLEGLLARGASVVACTHFGRPRGRVVEEFKVEPVRRCLAELCPGVELMENLRFNPGEETNDRAFGESLITGCAYFVNEAFSASHRAHASIMVPPTIVASAAGPNLQHEVAVLASLLEGPARPFVAVVGGAKVSDKLGVVKVLAEKADVVLVGGAMAFTFLASMGRTIGASLFSEPHLAECAQLMATGKVHVPVDARGLRSGESFGRDGGDGVVQDFGRDIPDGYVALDIGPATIESFSREVASAATVLWNGPMGVFEDPRFASGTEAVARAVAASRAESVVGGGDSVAALRQFGLDGEVNYVSTGGGASLQFVEMGDLPGLVALRESPFP